MWYSAAHNIVQHRAAPNEGRTVYITVQVPEERLPEVYELLLDRASRRPPAPPVGSEDDATDASAADADSADAFQLWNNVMPETRPVLAVLIRRPGEELTLDQLSRESGVNNVGAAMQSLRIQHRKLRIDSPVMKRRTRQGIRYSMTAETAAQFAHLAN